MITMLETADDIRSLTVQALRDAHAGFVEFAGRIDACCAAFEDGKDERGRAELACLTGPLSDFAHFCRLVMANCGDCLSDGSSSRMAVANQKLEHALRAVVDEAEDGNPIGIADACRIDLSDALGDYEALFPAMADELEQL